MGLDILCKIVYNVPVRQDQIFMAPTVLPIICGLKEVFFMKLFTGLLENRIFLAAALGWFVAQVLKTLIHLLFTRKFVAERLVGSGGMPSSHSATVCALVTATYMEHGSSGFAFAFSLILAIIVMYDAMGVRRETGIQAQLLNDIIKVFEDMGRKEISAHDKLKEFVGHTPLQVLVGGVLGILVAVFMYRF